MHRYVGVLVALLATVYSPRVLAAGNIGCLFSDTLCEQEREWCFDDHAFGHCLSHYGHYREEDLHRYELGSDELRLLEQQMQRLFLLGYRWSHTYTQCVLQELLHTIRRKNDFDISNCNGDVDQDLEGALRAIEGEELVDPRDLAIVRFTPSATDPHSDYADEVYFPPIKDQLLQDNSVDHQDSEDDQEDANDAHQESPTSEPGGSTGRADGGGRTEDSNGSPSYHPTGGGRVDSLSANPPGPPMNDFDPSTTHDRPPPHDPRQQNYMSVYGPSEMEDYDDSNSYRSPYHYQTPMNPVYRKRSRTDDNDDDAVAFLGGEKLTLSGLRRISNVIDNLRIPQERLLLPDRFQQTDNLDDQEGLEEGVFGESPIKPMYSEAGLQFIPEVEDDDNPMEPLSRGTIDLRMVPEGIRGIPDKFRNVPGVLDAFSQDNGRNYGSSFLNLPEAMRNFPGGLDILPRDYGPMGPAAAAASPPQEYLSPESFVPENSIRRSFYMPEPDPYEADKNNLPWEGLMLEDEDEGDDDFQNIFPRRGNKIAALEEAFGPQLNSIKDFDENYSDYPDYGGLSDDYGDYRVYDDARMLLPDRAFPFLQKFDKKDEERAGGDYSDMVHPSGLSFQRPERLDVKKPGPGFAVNDYAFEEYPLGDHQFDQDDAIVPDAIGGGDLFMTRLLSEGPRISLQPSTQEQAQAMAQLLGGVASPEGSESPDVILADEGIVDGATDDIINPVPKAERWQDKNQDLDQVGLETISPSVAPTETTTTEFEGPNSYVYITIDGRFKTHKEGSDLASVIVKLAGLSDRYVENLSVDEAQVMFQVNENRKGITASDVAKKAEELRGQVETETGLSINQSGVGNKTAMSAVVFSSSEKHILAAAAIVCGVMAALLVAASVLFFVRRKAKSKDKLLGLTAHDTEASKDYQDLCRARMAGKAGEGGKVEPPTTHVPSQRISSLSKDSDNGNNSPSSRSSTSSCEEPVASNMDISTGHMVLSYMEDHLKNKDRLEQEWIALCAYEAEPCATTLALKPENNKKNRYPDSVPYDHNRVVLNAHANVNGSDYINASSITDHDPRNPAYIATQGPLSATAADFWQLVWEQGSVVIVMLTRLTENGLAFCHRYWPEEGSDLYHIYEVHLVSEHIWCDDYLVRSFYLKNVKTGETRTVTQFHFLSWPDSGTPASTKALLEFRRKVNKSYRGRSCPIIVHCSDGIGRTGTYSLIDMVLNRMAKGAKEIDIAATLEHIRDQRPHMVKSKAQFEFVLMAVAEEVHAILKALPQ